MHQLSILLLILLLQASYTWKSRNSIGILETNTRYFVKKSSTDESKLSEIMKSGLIYKKAAREKRIDKADQYKRQKEEQMKRDKSGKNENNSSPLTSIFTDRQIIPAQGTATKKLKEQLFSKKLLSIVPGSSYYNNPNCLRIIAGVAKGKKINSPEVYLRPMMAKVREALFSSLTDIGLFRSNSSMVLDLFCGAGSVGLEALSRGAYHSTFVDLSPLCVSTATENAEICGFSTKQHSSVCASAEDFLITPERYLSEVRPYQLVSMTPPYLEISYPQLLLALMRSQVITSDTLIIVEYPVEMGVLPFSVDEAYLVDWMHRESAAKKRTILPSLLTAERSPGNKFLGLRNRRYGRTVIAIYVFNPTVHYDLRPIEFDIKHW